MSKITAVEGKRPRSLPGADVLVQKPEMSYGDKKKIEDIIVAVKELNDKKNEAARLYDKKRKELLVEMDKLGKDRHLFTIEFDLNGVLEETAYSAVIDTPVREVIDPAIMRTKVDEKVFLAMVSISKKAAEEQVGTAIINQCIRNEKGERNVTVTLKKAGKE